MTKYNKHVKFEFLRSFIEHTSLDIPELSELFDLYNEFFSINDEFNANNEKMLQRLKDTSIISAELFDFLLSLDSEASETVISKKTLDEYTEFTAKLLTGEIQKTEMLETYEKVLTFRKMAMLFSTKKFAILLNSEIPDILKADINTNLCSMLKLVDNMALQAIS